MRAPKIKMAQLGLAAGARPPLLKFKASFKLKTAKRKRRKSGCIKLDERAVRKMRRLYAAGATCKAIGEQFGCTTQAAHLAITGKTWSSVPGAVKGRPRGGHPPKPRTKLDERAVREVRRLYAAGATCKAIGEQFGCTTQAAHLAITGKTWPNVPGAVQGRPRGPRAAG